MVAFARRVPRDHVVADFGATVRDEFVNHLQVDTAQTLIQFRGLGHSVGTPMLAWWLPPED